MNEFKSYLSEELGLSIANREWPGAGNLPLYLAKAANYSLCSRDGVDFIAAEVDQGSTLPELKRISSQVSARAGLQVVLVAQIDARQRKALVSQGIPFVAPGRQAYLPMFGFAANAKREPAPLAKKLPPSTQAVLVTLLANPALHTSEGLMKVTGMPSSSVSRALDDLSRRGFIEKSKDGRQVVIERNGNRNSLVKSAMDCLRNPIVRTTYARKDAQTSLLPLAGESALSKRSMLTPPTTEQRAVSKKEFESHALDEVQLGELDDVDTVEIQVWSYPPLVTGQSTIDDVSLALTLVKEGDERVIGQLNALFEEEIWQ